LLTVVFCFSRNQRPENEYTCQREHQNQQTVDKLAIGSVIAIHLFDMGVSG
jgi:hypothetical protein